MHDAVCHAKLRHVSSLNGEFPVEYRGAINSKQSARGTLLLQVQAQNQQAFEQAVADLRYGCVAVNVTSMMGSASLACPGAASLATPRRCESAWCDQACATAAFSCPIKMQCRTVGMAQVRAERSRK